MQNLVRTSSIPAEAEPLKGIASGKSKWSKVMSWIREFLAVGFWIAIVGHLLFVDMFQLVREVHPTLSVLLQYRFFVLIGSISVAWLVLGNKAFSTTIAYILFYPIIVLFLHVPIAFAKHWALLIVFSPAIYSLIKHFRVNFLLTSLAAISALFVSFRQACLK